MTTQTDSPMGSAYISSPQEISMPTDNILSLRRWILGLVLGASPLVKLIYSSTHLTVHFFSVDFDLEHGPCVTDTKPEIELSSVERENMLVFSAPVATPSISQVHLLAALFPRFQIRSSLIKALTYIRSFSDRKL